jgi:MarR family 2-MHQ and catechol resistance regulon transcriptional repressor
MQTTKRYGRKTDLALGMWVKLARAYSTFNKKAVENIRTFGLTQAQFSIIEALGHLGPIQLGEMSRKQLTSCGNTTVIVDNLEKEGLVIRVPSKEDGRVTFVQLTKKGERLFDDVFVKHARYITDVASVLSEREQIQLSRLLKRLGTSLVHAND